MAARPYAERRRARAERLALRGLDYRLRVWDDGAAPDATPLVLLHGWMDVGASFQFLVDALRAPRPAWAPDWRGFGLTAGPSGADSYWFADYLADLDALLDVLHPARPVDLLGHSMGGNVAMLYAGVRPQRVRRLVNLEGFGLPATVPAQAPARYAAWLDALKLPQRLPDCASVEEVAQRLRRHNPRLTPERAAWLAPHWARPGADGRWVVHGDPAHKRPNPVLYRADEVLACWRRIEAPVLWVEGGETELERLRGGRLARPELEARIGVLGRVQRCTIEGAGHMLHHDQPESLAAVVERFLDAPDPGPAPVHGADPAPPAG